MEFRLLGPLEASREGVPLPLGGRKQRGILAVLLIQANETVSVDRIVDDVWGATPPRTVHAYVQNCIWRLRSTLGADVIETRPPGYRLRTGPDDVDAARFERAVDAARRLETPERAAALTEALALWRGPALADFAFEPFAQVESARLDELRLAAVELRLDAELELGRHDAVVAELDALATRHPTRERLRALQMLALYRAGRQRDALAAYQEARHELVDRFGLEPGEELRALERLILAQDPSLHPTVRIDERAGPPGRTITLVAEPATGEAVRVAERHGAVVQRTEPELVAVFGDPQPNDDDAINAIRAAAELRALPDARVAVDRVDGAGAPAPTRLLDSAAAGTLVVGRSLLPLVAHAVDVVPHTGNAFRVLRVDVEAEAVPRRFDVPLVGRGAELASLAAAVDEAARTGAVRRMVVTGDAGVGKTRLGRELASRVAGNVMWIRCRPHAGGTDATNQIIGQAGDLDAGLRREPDGQLVLTKLREHDDAERSEELWALRRLLEALARTQPLVVVFDDVQWADRFVLDLVDYVDGWASAPVVLVCLTRPELLEVRPAWAAGALALDALDDVEGATLLRSLPDASGLDDAAAASVLRAAEGNPLFLEQLVAWARDGAHDPVPPTIDMLVAARVARLPPEERRVLERASVAGVELWRAAVEAASPSAERARAGPALMSLVRRRFLRPARSPLPGEDGFRFHHVLIRDVVYAGIDAALRAEAHAAIARSLGDDERFDAIAGHHLEQAALHGAATGDEAGRRLGAAGMRALRRIDGTRAADLLARASRLTPEGALRRDLDWATGTALKFAGQVDAADERLADVIRRARESGDELNMMRARVEQLWPHLARGRITVTDALALLEEARVVFERAGDDFCTGRSWDLLATIDGVYRLRHANLDERLRRAELHYARAGFATGALATRAAGSAYGGAMPVREAIATCEALLAKAEAPVWASFVLPFLGALRSMSGLFDEARSDLEAARVARAEFAAPGTLATSWATLAAEVELRAEAPERAAEILTEAVAALQAAGDAEWLAMNGARLGEAELWLGHHELALSHADAALAAAPPSHLSSCARAKRVRAQALTRLGRTDEGLALAEEVVADVAETDALVERAEAFAAHAEALALAGAHDEAALRRDEAIAEFERKGDVVSAARVRRLAVC